MPDPAPDPRLQALINQLRPGPVRSVAAIGFDGADAVVKLVDGEGLKAEIGRILRHEASMRRVEHPSELFKIGQEVDAEEIGRWGEGQLHLSARACEIPPLRAFLLSMERGQVATGTVAEVHHFGVFVHVDGEPDGLCTGFIRVPDLAWSRSTTLREPSIRPADHGGGDCRRGAIRTSHPLAESPAGRSTHPLLGPGRPRRHRADHQDHSLRRVCAACSGGRGAPSHFRADQRAG